MTTKVTRLVCRHTKSVGPLKGIALARHGFEMNTTLTTAWEERYNARVRTFAFLQENITYFTLPSLINAAVGVILTKGFLHVKKTSGIRNRLPLKVHSQSKVTNLLLQFWP